MFERPPQLSGTEREQLRVLRDYLVRLAQSLERAQDAAIAVPASTQSPRRCDHLQLRLVGRGGMQLYALSRILEVGSDA